MAYAIGVSKPLSIYVKLGVKMGKGKNVTKIINQLRSFSRGIREILGLNKPIYQITAAYGHFGRNPTKKGEFSWEKTDKSSLFKL